MMYFFVSFPPNTFIIVRPDLSATSTKLATWGEVLVTGEALGAGAASCESIPCATNKAKATASKCAACRRKISRPTRTPKPIILLEYKDLTTSVKRVRQRG